MKKALVVLVALVAVVVFAVVGMAMNQPDAIHVERSIEVAASPADIAPYAEDLKLAHQWDPWEKKDPNSKKEYSENLTGVGAWYTWDGNEEVGRGKQTIIAVEPGKVVQKLEFFAPWTGEAETALMWDGDAERSTVTWAFDQPADFPSKVMGVFMSMEDMLGPDFEAGLASLKPLVEAAAMERAAAEADALEAAEKAAAEAADPEAEVEAGE